MLVSLCGTPGVGKTETSGVLEKEGFTVISLKDMVEGEGWHEGWDSESGSLIVDTDLLRERLSPIDRGGDSIIFIEGHLSYLAPADLVVVLRCDPDLIAKRLRERGYVENKVSENAEAEGLSIILTSAVEEERRAEGPGSDLHPRTILEIDTTHMDPTGVAEAVVKMARTLQGKDLIPIERYRPGRIDWTEVMARWF